MDWVLYQSRGEPSVHPAEPNAFTYGKDVGQESAFDWFHSCDLEEGACIPWLPQHPDIYLVRSPANVQKTPSFVHTSHVTQLKRMWHKECRVLSRVLLRSSKTGQTHRLLGPTLIPNGSARRAACPCPSLPPQDRGLPEKTWGGGLWHQDYTAKGVRDHKAGSFAQGNAFGIVLTSLNLRLDCFSFMGH